MKEGSEDWAFPTTKPGVTRETKIGLVMVLVLCCAFGFVLYNKFAKRKGMADSLPETAEETTEEPTTKKRRDAVVTPVSQETDEEDPFSDGVKTARKPPSESDDFTAQSEPNGGAQDLFDAPKSAKPKPRAKAPPIDEGDPFGSADAGPPGRVGRPPVSDGFDEAELEPQPRARRTPPGPPVGEEEASVSPPNEGEAAPEDFSDPFGGPVARSGPPAGAEPEDPGELQMTGNEAGAGDGFPPAAPPGRATPIPRGRAMVPPPGDDFGPQPRPVPRPAPIPSAVSDPFGNPAPRAASAPPTRPAPSASGFEAGDFEPPATARPTPPPRPMAAAPRTVVRAVDPFAGAAPDARPTVYEVQANDNYWSISKKQYGTYRYFGALAKFNSDRVPDPTKLRPGMKVMTPTPQALEARYPEMFGKKGTVSVSDVDAGNSGLFHAKSGQPMYRIGQNDTLTTIAQSHLGRSSRWIQIFEMNRDQLQNPENLKIGTVLRLPLDASNVRMSSGTVERR